MTTANRSDLATMACFETQHADKPFTIKRKGKPLACYRFFHQDGRVFAATHRGRIGWPLETSEVAALAEHVDALIRAEDERIRAEFGLPASSTVVERREEGE